MIDKLSKETIVITGGNGFLGSHLTNLIIEKYPDALVYVIDRLSTSVNKLITNPESINFIQIDLSIENSKLDKAIEQIKPTFIFHLAAIIPQKAKNFEDNEYYNKNMQITKNLIKSLIPQKINKLVNLSSSEVYGMTKLPFSEITEAKPSSSYGKIKYESELLLNAFSVTNNVKICNIRPFNVYGEGQNDNMLIPYLINGILNDDLIKIESSFDTREFNYVSDIVSGILLSALTDNSSNQTINLGNGNEILIKDLVNKVYKLMNLKPNVEFGKKKTPNRMFCDNSKSEQLLHWRPEVGLDAGLMKTIHWYKSNI